MNRSKKNKNYYFIWALFLSLTIHMVFLFFRFDFKKNDLSSVIQEKKIKIVFVDDEKNVNLKTVKEQKRQIVNSSQDTPVDKEVNSRFLGKTNQFFERQTIAKQVGSFKEAGLGVENGSDWLSNKIQNITYQTVKQNTKKKNNSHLKEKLSLKDLLVNQNLAKQIIANKDLASKGIRSGDKLKIGPSMSNDFIEDVKLGDFSKLNTTEYKYFGFYDRIRKRLEQFWGNSLQEKARKLHARGGRLPAGENKITSLKVTLDKKGNIVNVFIKSTSCIIELDEAAIESFKQAGPFPNPPQGMIESGYAEIEWGFVVKS